MRHKLLLDDDTPINLVNLKEVLTECNTDIYECNSGEKALAFLEHTLPDLILLDISMTGISGLEVCKRIKKNERTKDITVIFISAHEAVNTKIKGFDFD